MVSSRLFSERIVCQTHQTEHGSDHLAIVSEFMTEAPDVTLPPRRAYKNARWNALNLDVKNQLSRIEKIDPITNLEEYTTELINIVLEGIEKLVPLAKPSPYNKRWWTEDLSQLRKRYTLFRNQARRQRAIMDQSLHDLNIIQHKWQKETIIRPSGNKKSSIGMNFLTSQVIFGIPVVISMINLAKPALPQSQD